MRHISHAWCLIPASITLQCACVTAKSCEHAYNGLQRTLHEERLRVMTDPIQDTALLLFRESPTDIDAVQFAHRLLRTHDNFTNACYDHHWLDSLSHKLCASFSRWREWIRTKCTEHGHSTTLHDTTRGNTLLTRKSSSTAGASVRCLCKSLEPLLHACAHHDLPWATDELFCSQLRGTGACGHAHPFAGLCRLYHVQPTHASGMPLVSSVVHNTLPKHTSWKNMRKKQETIRHNINLHSRLMQKTSIGVLHTREHSISNSWSNQTDSSKSMLRNASHVKVGYELFIGALVRRGHHERHRTGALFDPRLCTKYETSGLRICALSNLTAMTRVFDWWAPNCMHIITRANVDMSKEIESHKCDIIVGWMPSIIRVYQNTPTAISTFIDPLNQATSLRIQTESVTTQAALKEYAHEVALVCTSLKATPHRPDRLDALPIVLKHKWFACDMY
jgi:hypothetical protein